jgi:hypothetical protein
MLDSCLKTHSDINDVFSHNFSSYECNDNAMDEREYTKMMSLVTNKSVPWKQLEHMITSDHSLQGQLFRTKEVQRMYYQNKMKIHIFYESFEDYIKISLLRFGSMTTCENKIASYQTHTSKQWVWCENTYPYSLRKGIHHYNIWSLTPFTTEQVDRIIQDNIGNSARALWFINDTQNMSVPGIWHCHVFWK